MKDIAISILGDCGNQCIADNFKTIRISGLQSWISIASQGVGIKVIEDELKDNKLSNYRIRCSMQDVNKTTLQYILEKKADYLILDISECRLKVYGVPELRVLKSVDEIECVTGETLSKTLFGLIKKKIDKDNWEEINAYELDFELYKSAIDYIVEAILQVYSPDEVILVEQKLVRDYIDGNHIYKFKGIEDETFKNEELLTKCFEYIKTKLLGAHIIEFPEYTLCQKDHIQGCFPLHYHNDYYDYELSALEIILSGNKIEKNLLKQLKELYETRFQLLRERIDNNNFKRKMESLFEFSCVYEDSEKCAAYLKSQTRFADYLDFLQIAKRKYIIIASVKDSPGVSMNRDILDKIHSVGFSKFLNKTWMMYCGVISDCGKTITQKRGSEPEETVTLDFSSNNIEVFLKSSSYRRENLSKIVVNGIDYSMNSKGINIIVFDPHSGEMLDSISYDAQSSEHTAFNHFTRSVAIWGSCVSRELFNYTSIASISTYILQNPIHTFTADGYSISENQLIGTSGFTKRMLKYEFEKKALELIKNNKADYLIIDTADCRSDWVQLKNNHNCRLSVGPSLIRTFKSNPELAANFEQKRVVDITEEQWEKYVDVFCDELLKIYDESHIILNEFEFATRYVKDGEIYLFDNLEYTDVQNRITSMVANMIKKRMPNIKIISKYEQPIADYYHHIGCSELHFTDDIYKKQVEKLKKIIVNNE